MRLRLWRRALTPTALGVSIFSAGCGQHALVYLPDPPAALIAVGDVRATVVEVQAPGPVTEFAVGVELDAPSGTTLLAARAAAASAAPCATGAMAALVAIGGQPRWGRPVAVGGHHLVRIDLPSAAQTEDGAPAAQDTVDLMLRASGGATSCLRLPLPHAGTGVQKRSAWSWGGGVRAEPPAELGYSAVARLGRWVGPLRVGAEVGGSLRGCGGCRSELYLGLPAALTAEVVAAARAGLGAGLELAYVIRPIVGTGNGDGYWLHGPRLTLRLVNAATARPNRPGGPRAHYASFDIWIGRWNATGVPHWGQTVGGIGWTWDDGL
ncbi:MAG: hypothetical protein ABJA82_04580 [Myxococcales bacterium]